MQLAPYFHLKLYLEMCYTCMHINACLCLLLVFWQYIHSLNIQKKKINKIIIEMSVQCIQRFLDYKAGNMINIEFSGYIFMDVEFSLLLHS